MAPRSPQQVVATVLRTLDRSKPPPSDISGAANRLRASASRLLSRRRMVLTVASVAYKLMRPGRHLAV